MIKYSDQVFGYISKPMKQRLRRIRETNRDYSESWVISMGLERIVPEIEKELGISGPVKATAKKKTAND